MSAARRKHWGWGYEHQQPDARALRDSAAAIGEHLGIAVEDVEQPVALEQLRLREPRVAAPAALAGICSSELHARACHALGKSYCDVVRGFRGQIEHPPDVVAFPEHAVDVERLLEWCAGANVAAIPFGGGTSVVGGVTPDVGGSYDGVVSIDLARMGGVVEVDSQSRSARIGAGALGPDLERELSTYGLTLRHFPQSFEYSTLGGWIATRAAGHFATVWTHIEDFVESVSAVTPSGAWHSRRLPASGAAISPDRMLAGSEGTLGVITEAWMRVQPRPAHRRSAGVAMDSFMRGAECVRAVSQSGLNPSNLRLLDAGEAALTMAGDGSRALLVLGFESTDHPVDAAMDRALEICAEHGAPPPRRADGDGADAVSSWREAFLGAPYLRDTMVAAGVLAETFETAITWERFPALHERVCAAALEALGDGSLGRVFCRFTHVYPDGPAPYFTVIARAVRGGEVEQWAVVKAAVSEAIIDSGGTITHHHAVGRDHLPWYERQRPEPFALALDGARSAIDPARIMNPGVLAPPAR